MNDKPRPTIHDLHEVVDLELAEVANSVDPDGDDVPEREVYEAELRSFHDAVVVEEKSEEERNSES
ncbi:hypothetical protein [Amycolatopsis sp. FDAARGOS 1241]|uniref:hypothetical protein n=1 Tax=Amycolatopsis sp. FDAARGOS 1241 TaxID=2778070 RepID=UPI00194DF3D3|nr:hypothetical protein [Amycolatopsis sp. FDAARGOS 1241]QRP42681.1 hypothetical protein I6J71_24605 [Amycolatopsis sp. FDAARGOS 1241]